jgi:Spy/CpxP family protein refolding chaperone
MVLFGSGDKRARLIGTALLIVTFVAGALAGAAATRVVSAEGPELKREGRGMMHGGPRRFLLDDQLSKELGLTDEQRDQVRAILDRRDREAKQMWSSFQPRMEEFGKAVREEIQKVLTVEQQKKLDAAIDQRRSAWKQRRNCPADSTNAMSKEKAS